MRKKILIIACLFSLNQLNAQVYNWSKALDGPAQQISQDIVVDNNSNTYTAGYIFNETDISGNSGFTLGDIVNNGYSSSNPLGLIIKYNANGVRQWHYELLGVQMNRIYEKNEEIYFVGRYTGAISVTTTSTGLESFPAPSNGEDLMIGRLNANGTLHSVNVLGGCAGSPTALYLTTNSNTLLLTVAGSSMGGNINGTNYGAGSFFGNNGILISLNPATDFSVNWYNIFEQGFDSDMTINGVGAVADPVIMQDVVIIGGSFSNTVDLNYGPTTTNISSSLYGGFIAKYTLSTGSYVSHIVIGANDYNYFNSLAISDENAVAGRIYVGGRYTGTCDFDPSPSTANLTSVSGTKGFLACYDYNLIYKDATSLSGTVEDLSVCQYGPDRQIAVIGHYQGNVQYETTTSSDSLVSSNSSGNSFVLTFQHPVNSVITGVRGFFIDFNSTSSLSKSIAVPIQSPSSDFPIAVNHQLQGNITVDMNGSSNTASYSNTSSLYTYSDWLIGRYTNQDCFTNETLTIEECGSYDFNGNTLTSSGTYTENFTNLNGCDSIVTLNLTITTPSSSIDTHSSCGAFTWIDGNTYTTNNTTATHFLTNAAGCDSIVTLNLTIFTNVSASATVNGDNSITATPSGMNYQWLNCATNTLISGANAATFSPTANGTYSVVVVSADGCSDTSSCVAVSTIGINELILSDISISPNPSNGLFKIYSPSSVIQSIRIVNLNGKIVKEILVNDNSFELILEQEAGVYFVELTTEMGVVSKRIIRN